MNKEEILQGLEKAMQVARRRESQLKQYRDKEHEIAEATTEAQTITWGTRIKAAKIPLIIFLIINFIVPKNMVMLVIEAPIGIVALILAIYKMVKVKDTYYNSSEYAEKMSAIENMRTELHSTLGASINASYQESLAAFPSLPKQYHTCFTLGKLINYFQCGRADTLKEAMEAYETDCHRMRMEQAQNQMLQEVQGLQNDLQRVENLANGAYYR